MNELVRVDARRIGQSEAMDDPLSRALDLVEGETITAHIYRFDPTVDREGRYQTFKVPYSRMMRVLDVLNYIAEDMEEDLAYRWFCGVKKCGTCAVRVNGRETLSCWESVDREMVIEPLRHAPVIRDLVVDRAPYEQLVFSMMPWLEREQAYPGFPERLSHRDMEPATNALDCLSCLACYSACPVLDLGDETNFSGPAPLVQLAQMALDPRDHMDRARIAVDQAGIFNCVSCYKCEEVCPVGIPVVSGIIEPLKERVFQQHPADAHHAKVFLEIIEDRGRIDPGKLVLRVQGLPAALRIGRIVKLLMRGKIYPLRTFFGKPIPGIDMIRKLFWKSGAAQ